MKKWSCLILILFVVNNAFAQLNRYVIQFKNKGSNTFSLNNPLAYLSQKAIDKRTSYNIQLDSLDLPITQRYIDSVRLSGSVTILNKSKWLNQISILTTDASAITKINALPFVVSVKTIAARLNNNRRLPIDKFKQENILEPIKQNLKTQSTQDVFNYGNTYNEIKLHNGQFLHNIGMRGEGMLLAIIDAGFYQYKTLSSFDSMNINNQVVQTWDFVARDTSVVEDDSHGMSCLSTITGNIPGTFVGMSPKTNVVLYRSEDAASEYPIEELNWVCALERADSIGAKTVSTSLGYTTFDDASFDYVYANMNGKTTTAAKGGTIAHRKGLLLFSANGNDGNSGWKYLSTPADIDSTIAVGAVTSSGSVGNFSSYGPSADNRIKPDVATVGVNAYVQNPGNTVSAGNGTSYACPKMAGLGTCLWQAFPEFNNYTIREAIIKSGNIYTTPNDRIGYGIPDMKKAFVFLLNKYANITSSSINNCKTNIVFKSKDFAAMRYEVERKVAGQTSYARVASFQGSGSTLSNKTITYADTLINVQPGTIQYRIKQVVDTAVVGYTETYLDSVTLDLNAACVVTGINPTNNNIETIALLPNPANNTFNVKITTNYAIQNLGIRITDASGKSVIQLKKSTIAGTTSIAIPIHFLAKGTYLVSVFNGQKIISNLPLLKL